MKKISLTICLLIASFSILNSQTIDLKNGLIAYYPFKGNANDESGNNHKGIVNNASLTEDRNDNKNNAYYFNGKNSYISFNNFNPNEIKTINFWMKPKSLENPVTVFFIMKDLSSENGFAFYKTNNMFVFEASDGQKSVHVSYTLELEDNKYAMITCGINSSGFLQLYINSKLKASSTEKITEMSNSTTLLIGTNIDCNKYFYNGTLEELRLYNRPLSNNELFALSTGYSKDDMEGYFPFIGNANDESGNNHNGIVNNATLVKDRNDNTDNAYYFNGKNSYISFNNLDPNKIKSINFWIKPKSFDDPIFFLFGMMQGLFSENGFALYKSDDRFIFEASNGKNSVQVVIPFSSLDIENYSMITCNIGKDDLLYLYINEKLIATSSEKIPIMANDVTMILGSDCTEKKYFFNGTIEKLSLFNRPIEGQELNALYSGNNFYLNNKSEQISTIPKSNKSDQLNIIPKNNNQESKKQVKVLPDLVIKNEYFVDVNGNNIIDAGENDSIKFKLENIGKGDALNIRITGSLKNPLTGLDFHPVIDIGNIKGEEGKEITLPIHSDTNLINGIAEFKIEVIEERGLDAFPLEMKIETQPFQAPNILTTDAQFSTEDGGKIKLNYPISLKVIVQNIGKGSAERVKVNFSFVNDNCLMLGEADSFALGTLKKGESKQLEFLFTATRRYTLNEIPIKINLSEILQKYARDTIVSVRLDQDLIAKNQVIVQGIKTTDTEVQIASLSCEVDKNIPLNDEKNNNRYALIIGNEDYNKYQKGLNSEMNVEFARNDATIFKEYCIKTLGIPEDNILFILDATIGEMSQKIELISKLVAKTGENAELIFYYAGHGLPDDNTKVPYLIPVDVNASNIIDAIKISDIYKKFAESGAKRISVFLDACFSGGARGEGLLATRSIKIIPKQDVLTGNFVVFTASSGEQSALAFKDKQHGIFTYYLLKKMQETKGNITYGELSKYLIDKVSLESLKINQKEQDPQVNVSIDVKDIWNSWVLK
jgi:hypothetical protein